MPLESRRLGVIKWYNAKKGFGFICPDLDDIPFTIGFVGRSTQSATSSNGDTADAAVRRPAAPADVFMHKSVLQPGVSLKDNERVEFEMGVDKKGRKVAVRCETCILCICGAHLPGNALCVCLCSVWQSTKPRALHHRQWVAADFQQLKSLHEEWFPVRYPDSYWRQACERHLSLEGWPLLTLTSHTPDNAGRIVGCISAVIMDIDACIGLDPVTIIGAGGIASKPTQDSALLPFHRTLVSLIASAGQINIHGMACYCDCGWSCADANGHPAETAVYLKTLGVREEARRHGCAIELVNACELYAKEVRQTVDLKTLRHVHRQ